MTAMAVMAMIRADQGFTLTELAVVLVIVSLLMGGLLIPLGAQQEIEKRRATEQQLNNIRETLIAFGTVNLRLPCPDTNNDGLEDVPCTGNAVQDGGLPWKTMAIAELDAWGGNWRYRIERGYANAITLKSLILQNGDDCFGLNSAFPGDCLDIRNNAGTRLNSDSEHPIAIIYSTGPNRQADGHNASYEAARANEPIYQSDVPSTSFDDLLIWVNRSSLITTLIARGQLP